MLRRIFVFLHRYVGLALALFLIVEGLTGSLLAFNAELSAMLDPRLVAHRPTPESRQLDLAALAMRAEELRPRAMVGYFFRLTENEAFLRLGARDDPKTGEPGADPGIIVLNRWTGEELSQFPYGGYTQGFLANLMPFVWDLHTTLALGDRGVWILAFAALFWTIDCFVGFYLTLPVSTEKFWRRWRPSWLVKWRGCFYRVNFDLHRASGLWLWVMLFVFAWSSVCLVDPLQIYQNVTAALFDTRPQLEQAAAFYPLSDDKSPVKLGWRAAQAMGERLAAEQAAAGGYRLLRPRALNFFGASRGYNYIVETDRPFPHDRELVIFFDADDGASRGVMATASGHFGETLTVWLRGLHMVRDPMDRLPYRVFVCVMGLVVAVLSITGVYVWWRKRRARLFHRERSSAAKS